MMIHPNTPLPSTPYQTFRPLTSQDTTCHHPTRIINPTSLTQGRLNPVISYTHRLGTHSAPQSTFAIIPNTAGLRVEQTRRHKTKSLLSLSERHRGSLPCNTGPTKASSGLHEIENGRSQSGCASSASAGQRPARSYIRSWRREVGEAVTGDADRDVEEKKESFEQFRAGRVGLPEAPHLEQRDSTFSISQLPRGSQDEQEHTSDVQQDVPLNTFSLAVETAAEEKLDENVDAVRKEIIRQERLVSDRQAKQHNQEQKKALAEKMVDTVHDLICSTWPSACDFDSPKLSASNSEYGDSDSAAAAAGETQSGLIPLRAFIKEILRRSKSSCATLRCAEWYLLQVRRILIGMPEDSASTMSTSTSESSEPDLNRLPVNSPLMCPRRAFLSALIVAHKFLHDRVYSNRAWAKVSGLDVTEIGKGELALACLLDWKLWVGREEGDPNSGKPEHDETSWFSAVGRQVPIPLEGPIREQPANGSPVEIATQCSSTGSSPSPASASVATLDSAPRLGVPPAGSAFSAMTGSFAFISPFHWEQHCANVAGYPRSAVTILSSSMPGLSLDGLSDSSVSPVTTEKDGEIHILLNSEEQFAVQIVSSPQSYTAEHSTARSGYNRLKRGSPVEEGHIKSTHMHATEIGGPDGLVAGKKRRVTIGKAQPTRIRSLN